VGRPSLLEVVQGPVESVDTRNNKRQGKVDIKRAGVVLAGVPHGRARRPLPCARRIFSCLGGCLDGGGSLTYTCRR
jgi:hypothetical protein